MPWMLRYNSATTVLRVSEEGIQNTAVMTGCKAGACMYASIVLNNNAQMT
jgi:hypothetical protein